jgi:hypothetical protein
MAVLRTDVERALDELASQEEGMRLQGLAVVLGKKRWPELIARQRKKDLGLDAYAPASLTPEKIGKGLAASITPTLKKISDDAKTAKENFPDLKTLLFVTSAKVGNADQKQWKDAIHKDHGLELHIIEREEIITLMMMPENASLRASFLHIEIDAEPPVADLIDRTRRAADAVTRTWAAKTRGHPLIDLTAVRLDLLPQPEYLSDAAAAMARDFVPKPERSFDRTFRYDLMWAAREGRVPPPGNDQRRTRFAAALNAQIGRLREQQQDGKPAAGQKELAKALAAIDARRSAAAVLDVIAMPGLHSRIVPSSGFRQLAARSRG